MSSARKFITFSFLLFYSFTLLLSFAAPLAQAAADICDLPRNCNDPDVLKNCIQSDDLEVKACDAALHDVDNCKFIKCTLDNSKNTPPTNQWWNPSLKEFSDKVFDAPETEIFGERYTYAQVNWIINSLFTLMLPRAGKMEDIVRLIEILNKIKETGQLPAQVQPLADIINYPYTNPVASAKSETVKLLAKLNVVTPAQAQGLGYSKLAGSNNINILWSATRNMAYLISILLLLAAGFMIMFRTKINPQTIASVQMIIPRLAVSLVLITFSLAIVGFVIDMIYVAIAAFLALLNINGTITSNLGADITTLTTAGSGFVASFFLQGYIIIIIFLVLAMLLLQMLSVPGGALIYMVLGLVLSLLAWAIISAVRIIITLFHAYLNLVILTITGPLQIMLDVVPGKENHFWKWLKCVIGNASVFVITAILVVFAVILFNFGRNSANLNLMVTGLGPGFNVPFIGGDVFLFGNITRFGVDGAGQILGALLLPMAFFSAMPTIMVSLRNALCKQDDPSQQITEAINGVIKQLTSGHAYEKRDKGGNLEKWKWIFK